MAEAVLPPVRQPGQNVIKDVPLLRDGVSVETISIGEHRIALNPQAAREFQAWQLPQSEKTPGEKIGAAVVLVRANDQARPVIRKLLEELVAEQGYISTAALAQRLRKTNLQIPPDAAELILAEETADGFRAYTLHRHRINFTKLETFSGENPGYRQPETAGGNQGISRWLSPVEPQGTIGTTVFVGGKNGYADLFTGGSTLLKNEQFNPLYPQWTLPQMLLDQGHETPLMRTIAAKDANKNPMDVKEVVTEAHAELSRHLDPQNIPSIIAIR